MTYLDLIRDADRKIDNGDITLGEYEKMIEPLKREIQPERKTGKWIRFPNHYAYKCSECGRIIETTDGKKNVCKHFPYCHCGTKMRGAEDG